MTIFDSTTQCKDLFRRYLLLVSRVDRDRLPSATDSSDRFRLWAYTTRAMFDDRESMDWRLVVGSVFHSSIMDLLTRLVEVIESEIHDLDSRNPEQISSITQPGANKEDSIDDVLESLSKRWRQLTRWGALNRRAHAAFQYFEYDEQTRENLTSKFRYCVRDYLDTTLKDTSQVIRKRLEDTIFRRHQHLCSLKARSRKERDLRPFDEPEPEPSRLTTMASCGSEIAPSTGARTALQSTQRSKAVKTVPTETGLSVRTAATALTAERGRQHSKKRRRDKPLFSTAEFPPRPSTCTEMECPYCFEVCRPEVFTREEWPRHIMQDLMPFVCVYERCPSPSAMFDSYAKWMKHTEKYHMGGGWKCHYHHFSMTFDHIIDFRRHLIECHGCIPVSDSVFEQGYPPCDPLRSCPFCAQCDDEHTSEDLHEHIARHLIFLSQVSLPGDFVDLKAGDFGSEFDEVSSGNILQSSWLPSMASSDTAQVCPLEPSATKDEGLSANIQEPPLIKHEDGEPDTWVRLGFSGAAQASGQTGGTKPQYNPETDGVLVPFRLRYVSETQDYQKSGVDGDEGRDFIRSSVQLARSLDTKGQYATAGAIMKKLITDCVVHTHVPSSEEYARATIQGMLQSCPPFQYQEVRKMLDHESTDSDSTDSEITNYTRTDNGSVSDNSSSCSPRHAKRKGTHDTVYSHSSA